MSFQWSLKQAVAVIIKTYREDWGLAKKQRAEFLQTNTNVSEFTHKGLTGLQAGAGQTVVFLHGSPANAMRWSQYLKNLPDGYQFISLDRMGFGHRGQQEPDLEDDYTLISGFIEELDNPIIVAHSLGGAPALRLANAYKLKQLVLIACSLDPELEKIAWIQKVSAIKPLSYILSRTIRHSNAEMLQLPDFMKKTEEGLGEIVCPTCVIHPKDDGLVSVDNVAYAQKYIKNIEAFTPETGGHFIPWTHQALIMSAITKEVA